jgi:signal transduction histidine kinase/ActR/RegA family two-component response regulator
VVFIEPMNERTRRAMGYDLSFEADRRAALGRARDNGAAAVTGRLVLAQEPKENAQAGFAMYLPLYQRGSVPQTVEERRALIVGYIYAPFRMNDLMQGILSGKRILAGFEIYDGLDLSLMYDGKLAGYSLTGRSTETSLQIGDRHWILKFTDSDLFRDSVSSLGAGMAAVMGVAVSFVLFIITFLMRRMVIERRQSAEAMIEAEKKLMQAQKMESIGHLTGGIAHDFNNLLQVILGNTDMLAEEMAQQPRLRGMAEMARAAAERGAELTHRLLAFARKQPLDPKPTDLNKLVANMDGLLRRSLGEQVEIESVLGGGVWNALLDAPQMENAILNLCINARDAMLQGGRVTIETANAYLDDAYAVQHPELLPGQYVLVAVSDTGVGMDKATLAQVFEPFFTTKDVGKGSGLGLSMIYGFVKQSKGHVKIYSEPGQGTTVRLYLPRAAGEAAQSDEERPASALPGGTERILLVEDDDLVRGHVSAQLSSLGYRVVNANGGLAAIDALRGYDDFDLLFTDIVMPGGMNGRQLAEKARRLRPNLRVLFTSGYTENATLHHGRLEKGARLLQKPYRRQDLAAKLRSVLDATDAA